MEPAIRRNITLKSRQLLSLFIPTSRTRTYVFDLRAALVLDFRWRKEILSLLFELSIDDL